MSDLMTHWAVFDDVRRLIHHDPQINDLFRATIEDQVEYARLGAITRYGNVWMSPVFDYAREHWDNSEMHPALEQKLAFVLGCLTHQACDHFAKHLLRRLMKPEGKREISAYYDVYVFRKVYLEGDEEPFNTFMFANNTTTPGQALEDFARSLFQRALLSSHTMVPDNEHIIEWLDSVFDHYQRLYISVQMYVDIFLNPDPELMQLYEVETTFYNADDPAIRVCRALQAGETPTPDEIKQALDLDA
ncbi:hypothetical protein HC928_25380, partial [bacterium]|nr:hypothetical protein [bacterium]